MASDLNEATPISLCGRTYCAARCDAALDRLSAVANGDWTDPGLIAERLLALEGEAALEVAVDAALAAYEVDGLINWGPEPLQLIAVLGGKVDAEFVLRQLVGAVNITYPGLVLPLANLFADPPEAALQLDVALRTALWAEGMR